MNSQREVSYRFTQLMHLIYKNISRYRKQSMLRLTLALVFQALTLIVISEALKFFVQNVDGLQPMLIWIPFVMRVFYFASLPMVILFTFGMRYDPRDIDLE